MLFTAIYLVMRLKARYSRRTLIAGSILKPGITLTSGNRSGFSTEASKELADKPEVGEKLAEQTEQTVRTEQIEQTGSSETADATGTAEQEDDRSAY